MKEFEKKIEEIYKFWNNEVAKGNMTEEEAREIIYFELSGIKQEDSFGEEEFDDPYAEPEFETPYQPVDIWEECPSYCKFG